jgi:hypothetical protein
MARRMSRREIRKEIIRQNTTLWERFKDWAFMWSMLILLVLLIIMLVRLYSA